ncbi:zinc finger MYM-type protein 1-like [Pistacia vera]|uniref:zinc finger MYM-type protein 1-like n=1 Tax=Pistacia vera TaxID=55513 RepID=UPI0012632407|nr:zinc finger MYM-type protein 1-like [Pistacia vera]
MISSFEQEENIGDSSKNVDVDFIAKDAAFCLCCYLFKLDGDKGGGDRFVGQGFSNWKKKEKLNIQVGGSNSAHNQARRMCETLLNQDQHIQTFFYRHSSQARTEYRTRLNATVDCIRFLLRQGLAFRGHDESYDSSNQGNFLELLQFLANHNKDYNVVAFKNAPDNLKLTSPKIQKDIVSAASNEIVSAIIRDLGDSLFCIMIDESRDISRKEQMTIVLCYVNKNGLVVELFLGVEHVTSTTTLSLKTTLYNFFSRHGLSFSRLQGQGYDGASNMQGEFNGSKTLVLKENRCAYYIHCFAHQLELAFVALAKNHDDVNDLFNIVAIVVNIVCASSKHCNLLRDKQACKVIETLSNGELSSGKCLNQETNLQRASDSVGACIMVR